MKLDLLNRTITAVALVALAISLGVWLTRNPLVAAPAATPIKAAPEPVLAPPKPVRPAMTPTIIEVPVEVEIAAAPDPLSAATPAVGSDDPKPAPQATHPSRRWGLFRRR